MTEDNEEAEVVCSEPNDITLEIVEAIEEVRLMREGKIPALTLNDI